MSAAWLVVGWILATAAAPTGALADPAPATAAAAPEADATKDKAIAELAEIAAREFDQRRFTEAEETLRRAIALSARPRLFYNLAQAYRADGNCASARDAYGEFLARASADDSTRERAQRWLKEMQDCVDRTSATKDVPPASESTPSLAAVPPPKPPTIVAAPSPAPTAPSAREITELAVRSEPPTRTAGRVRPARLVGWGLIGAGVLAEESARCCFSWTPAAFKGSWMAPRSHNPRIADCADRGTATPAGRS